MDQGIENPRRTSGNGAAPADYIFLLRPMILIPVWSFFLLGAHHGTSGAASQADISSLLAGLISFTLITGSFYVINQITDRGTDLENDKLFLLSRGIITVRAAVAETIVLIVISFLLAILFLPWTFSALLLASLILGAAYSLEPARMKGRFFFDIASNAAGIGLLAPIAGSIAAGGGTGILAAITPYPLAVASVHLVTTLADIRGDRSSGLRTSGVMLGRSWSIIVSVLLMLSSLFAAFLVDNMIAFYTVLLSLPFYLVLAGNSGRGSNAVLIPAKGATLAFAVAASVIFRLFLPFLAALVIATRIYYRRRFGISYPSFR